MIIHVHEIKFIVGGGGCENIQNWFAECLTFERLRYFANGKLKNYSKPQTYILH